MSAKPREGIADAAEVEGASPGGELDALLRASSSRLRSAATAVVLGRITQVDATGAVHVDAPGVEPSRPARLALPLSRDELMAAMRTSQPVVLAFEQGDAARPIIIGLLQGAPAADIVPSREPAVLAHAAGAASPEVPQAAPHEAPRALAVTADVDGRRVRIVAEDEIVLECGSASITLRRNGRVIVRGTYVETHSEGTNRIKGGQVRIN